MDTSVIYTITSTDPDNYNVIRTNLQVPFGELCRLTVNNLTTKANFVILNTNDYIVVNDKKYYFNDNYGELTTEGFGSLLTEMLKDEGIISDIDNLGRLVLSSDNSFTISEMSYNAKMISGFYNDKFPLTSILINNDSQQDPLTLSNIIVARSIGYSLSTPILYLVSNLGAKCYDNIDELYCDRKVLMRASNSFTANYPIINSNAEFTSIVPVNSLSNIEFRLVDANMHDIKLLTPMYLSVQTDSINNEEEGSGEK